MNQELMRRISIPIPCPVPWRDMEGNERVRFCGTCQKRVTNLSALRSDEVAAFLLGSSDPKCVRIYRRPDGTILTSDCTPSWREAMQKATLTLEKHKASVDWLPKFVLTTVLILVTLVAAITVFSQNLRALFAASSGELAGADIPASQFAVKPAASGQPSDPKIVRGAFR